MFGIEYQNVELPFVASTCPNVPVPLFESLNSPVRRSLSIVDEARYARPVAEKLPETKALVVVLLVVNRLVIVALVALKVFADTNPVTVKFDKVPTVVMFG